MSNKFCLIDGKPSLAMNGAKRPRAELAEAMGMTFSRRRAVMSFDAARAGTDLEAHFKYADSLDPDSSHCKGVRDTLVKRSRYEEGSNAYYDGSILKHVNRIVGATGPQLRMLTGNRNFNQLVEREFFKWMQATQLRRKLWAMCHARVVDGETFALLQTNPALPDVQLDITPIECEQCQTPYGPINDTGIIDGVYYDEFNNIVSYDILPAHPGGSRLFLTQDAVRLSASEVVHWFKLRRPGAHRGIPAYTSALAVGGTSRRHREATVAAAETAADIAALIHSRLNPTGDDERYPLIPMTEVAMPKRAIVSLPEGWEANQMKGEHPNATYGEFHRLQNSELGAPIAQPVNVTGGDSSDYSFASGKLDTLLYREAVDTERQDCTELVLDPIFAAWFKEWTIVAARRDIIPNHQWDWPAHPVIDAVSEATATDMKLKNGTVSLRQVYSDQGQDLEDQLVIMAEDTFGDASDENIAKMRQIVVLNNTSRWAIDHVAGILGVVSPKAQRNQPTGAVDDKED